MSRVRWGILSTGVIAHAFAEALALSQTGILKAVGSRTFENAESFAKKFGSIRAYGDYSELLADPEIDAVYLATPHPQHLEWGLKAIKAGKHLLCEKPLTMNYAQACLLAECARRHDRLLMEAFMYRCHPQIARLVDLLRNGAIGEVRSMEAAFCFQIPFQPQHRLFNKELGGGSILDIGCYPVSFSRLVAGAAWSLPFAEPEEVQGTAVLSEKTGVDLYATASLRFPGGILAQLACGTLLPRRQCTTIWGSEGTLQLPNPWHLQHPATHASLVLHQTGNSTPEHIILPPGPIHYVLEIDAFADTLARGERSVPAMPVQDSLGNMQTLDRWRKSVGLTYDADL